MTFSDWIIGAYVLISGIISAWMDIRIRGNDANPGFAIVFGSILFPFVLIEFVFGQLD